MDMLDDGINGIPFPVGMGDEEHDVGRINNICHKGLIYCSAEGIAAVNIRVIIVIEFVKVINNSVYGCLEGCYFIIAFVVGVIKLDPQLRAPALFNIVVEEKCPDFDVRPLKTLFITADQTPVAETETGELSAVLKNGFVKSAGCHGRCADQGKNKNEYQEC